MSQATTSTELATAPATSPELRAIQMQIAELEQQLLTNDPQMPQYLKRIHACLLQQPELVHIIRPEERAVIISGLSKITGAVIATTEKKTAAKRLSNHTVDDI